MTLNNEPGKTVPGKDWPLTEMQVSKNIFTQNYIESGRMTGEKLGFFLGQDREHYYIVWYMIEEEKITLLNCTITDFELPFPTEQIENERDKLFPEYEAKPIRLKNDHLQQIKKKRQIERI